MCRRDFPEPTSKYLIQDLDEAVLWLNKALTEILYRWNKYYASQS